MMLTRFIKTQLFIFIALTVLALLALSIFYLRLPSVAGIGQYQLKVDLPAAGGLYKTSNVTYRGVSIGRVTDVVPTETGAQAILSISDKYKIPADASANVHSVTAVGEQYLDLVSATGNTDQVFKPGSTITKSTIPTPVGPALDRANAALAAIPAGKLPNLLDETAQAVGGLGPTLQKLVNNTNSFVGALNENIGDINSLVDNTPPILDSQVQSQSAIYQWARNLNSITGQLKAQDPAISSILQQGAPATQQLNTLFVNVKDALPQTLANLEIIIEMLKRYNKGVEQALVLLPLGAGVAQTNTQVFPGEALLDLGLSINQPAPCLTGFLPAGQWRSPADTSLKPVENGLYCKIPQDTPANAVRGARNIPCVDVPGKRAATPAECRSNEPYVPLGTNPWFGDPNQILTCPAPGAACDQPVNPGTVIPGPTINTGLNPLPADLLPPPPAPISDPVSKPGQGAVQCADPAAGVDIRGVQPGWPQPGQCSYQPAAAPATNMSATYNASTGEITGPDGTKYTVKNSTTTGDDGWKEMLAPVS
jgi:phospholipid/cholesterol/gamma-HCH transport system substrate-binding protein